jgi:hypothetical protein
MAFNFSVNNRYVGLGGFPYPKFADAWFKFKQFMTTARGSGGGGWIVLQSGCGSVLSTTGDIITGTDNGPNGMANDSVWWVMTDPDETRQLLFSRMTPITSTPSTDPYQQAGHLSIKYSAKDGFKTATGAQTLPTAVDEITLCGEINWGQGLDYSKSWNIHFCADTVAPYFFYFMITSQSNILGFFCMDKVIDAHPLDLDPVVFYTVNTIDLNYDINSLNNMASWYNKPATFGTDENFTYLIGTNQAAFLPSAILYYTTDVIWNGLNVDAITVPNNMPTSIYDGEDDLFPVMYCRVDNVGYVYSNGSGPIINTNAVLPYSYKGSSDYIKLLGTSREQFDLFNTTNQKDMIAIGSPARLAIPWKPNMIINIA